MAVATTRVASTTSKLPDTRRQLRFRLLELDPELGEGLDQDQWPLAAAAATARVFRHERGAWRFFPRPDHGSLGALVIDGLILVRVELEGRGHLEVLGEGDVISPWVGIGAGLSLPTVVTAQVACELRLALLDQEFTRRTAPWPEIHAALMQRLIIRARRLALQSAINSLPRTEDRVELTLWQLAYRFGKVTCNGFKLQLRLTHSQLSDMVAAQRPSVSVALARLTDAGRLQRPGKDEWLLCGPPPAGLSALTEQSGLLAQDEGELAGGGQL